MLGVLLFIALHAASAGVHNIPLFYSEFETILSTNMTDQADTVIMTPDVSDPALEAGEFVAEVTLEVTAGVAELPFGLTGSLSANSGPGQPVSSVYSIPLTSGSLAGFPCPKCATCAANLKTATTSVLVANYTEAVYLTVIPPAATASVDYSVRALARNQTSAKLLHNTAVSGVAACGALTVYYFDVAKDGHYVVRATSPTFEDNGVMFIRYGEVPTATDFDVRVPFKTAGTFAFSQTGSRIGDLSNADAPTGRYFVGVAADVAKFEYNGFPRPSVVTDDPACCNDVNGQGKTFTLEIFEDDDDYFELALAIPPAVGVIVVGVLFAVLAARVLRFPPNLALFTRVLNSAVMSKFQSSGSAAERQRFVLGKVMVDYPNPIFGSSSHWLSMLVLGVACNGPVLVMNYVNAFDNHQGGEGSICRYNHLCKRDVIFAGVSLPAFNHVYSPIVYAIAGAFVIMWTAVHTVRRHPSIVDKVHYREPPQYLFYAFGVSVMMLGLAQSAVALCPNRFVPIVDRLWATAAVMWLVLIVGVKIANRAEQSTINPGGSFPFILAVFTGLALAALRPRYDLDGFNWGVLFGTAAFAGLLHLVWLVCATPRGKTPFKNLRAHVGKHLFGWLAILLLQIVVVCAAVVAPLHPADALLIDASALYVMLGVYYIFRKLMTVNTLATELDPSNNDTKGGAATKRLIYEHMHWGSVLALATAIALGVCLAVLSVATTNDIAGSNDDSVSENEDCIFFMFDHNDTRHFAVSAGFLFMFLFLFHVDDDVIEPVGLLSIRSVDEAGQQPAALESALMMRYGGGVEPDGATAATYDSGRHGMDVGSRYGGLSRPQSFGAYGSRPPSFHQGSEGKAQPEYPPATNPYSSPGAGAQPPTAPPPRAPPPAGAASNADAYRPKVRNMPARVPFDLETNSRAIDTSRLGGSRRVGAASAGPSSATDGLPPVSALRGPPPSANQPLPL